MSSDDILDRIEKHGSGLTAAIKRTRERDSQLAEDIDREWGAFLNALANLLKDFEKRLEH